MQFCKKSEISIELMGTRYNLSSLVFANIAGSIVGSYWSRARVST